MDQIAQTYVRLALAVGQHDPYYVDAYYGPPEWQTAAAEQKTPLDQIRQEAVAARAGLNEAEADAMLEQRRLYLGKQLDSLIARIDIVSGVKMPFDEESSALYDVVDEHRPDSYYEEIISKLEPLLPGEGPLSDRYEQLRKQFFIPKDKLEPVFQAAIEAARQQTKRHISLPAEEDFRIEYMAGEVWSAYNWYKGNSQSLIQVNTDFPMSVERALHLACHEGYPGHHVYNVLLEQHLMRERQWVEFSIYPLYSPQSLIAEGTAEYGVELAFPIEERRAFEQDVLYPLAGLDPSRAEQYSQVLEVVDQLGYAANDAARRYLDGKATREETKDWLVRYALSKPERAEQSIKFFENHRSYVVTYDIGQDLVKRYIESHATSVNDRWALFIKLLSLPQTPSALR